MHEEFSEAFDQLFANSDIKLERILRQKLRATRANFTKFGVVNSYEELVNHRINKISVTSEEVSKNLLNFEKSQEQKFQRRMNSEALSPISKSFKMNKVVSHDDGFHIKPLKDLGFLTESIQLKKLLQKTKGDTTKGNESCDPKLLSIDTESEDQKANSQKDTPSVFNSVECNQKITEMIEQHPYLY